MYNYEHTYRSHMWENTSFTEIPKAYNTSKKTAKAQYGIKQSTGSQDQIQKSKRQPYWLVL